MVQVGETASWDTSRTSATADDDIDFIRDSHCNWYSEGWYYNYEYAKDAVLTDIQDFITVFMCHTDSHYPASISIRRSRSPKMIH